MILIYFSQFVMVKVLLSGVKCISFFGQMYISFGIITTNQLRCVPLYMSKREDDNEIIKQI